MTSSRPFFFLLVLGASRLWAVNFFEIDLSAKRKLPTRGAKPQAAERSWGSAFLSGIIPWCLKS